MDDQTLYYENLRQSKCCLDKHGLPYIFTLHESQIHQSELEDGAARLQKTKYVTHIAARQKAAPNAKHQDPYEVSLDRNETKPWTWSRDAFFKKVKEDPDFNDFMVRAWAHQHLFESRKITVDHFTGTRLEASYRHHQLIIWVGLTYEEESELSAVHNQVSHDVNKEDIQDILHKLRYSWVRLGRFDSDRAQDFQAKAWKASCFKTVGVQTAKQMNSYNPLWKIATSPEHFFQAIIKVADMHDDGLVLDQKVNARADTKGKAKVGQTNFQNPVDFNTKFKDNVRGSPAPTLFFYEMSWIKRSEDYDNITRFLQNVINQDWSLPTFQQKLAIYKNIKFLRIQLRVQVRKV